MQANIIRSSSSRGPRKSPKQQTKGKNEFTIKKENTIERPQFNGSCFYRPVENGDKAPALEREYLAKCKRLQQINKDMMSKQQVVHCLSLSLRNLRNRILEKGGRDMEAINLAAKSSNKMNNLLINQECPTVVYLENCGDILNNLLNPWKELTNRILNYFGDGCQLSDQNHLLALNEYHQDYFDLKMETENKINELIQSLTLDTNKKEMNKPDSSWQQRFMSAKRQLSVLEGRLSEAEAQNRNKLEERDRREKQLEDKLDALSKALQQQNGLVRKAEEDKLAIRNENVELSKKLLNKDHSQGSLFKMGKSQKTFTESKLIERLHEAEQKIEKLQDNLRISEESNKNKGVFVKKTQQLERMNRDFQDQLEARDRLLQEQSLVVNSKNEMIEFLREKEKRLQHKLANLEKREGVTILT